MGDCDVSVTCNTDATLVGDVANGEAMHVWDGAYGKPPYLKLL